MSSVADGLTDQWMSTTAKLMSAGSVPFFLPVFTMGIMKDAY